MWNMTNFLTQLSFNRHNQHKKHLTNVDSEKTGRGKDDSSNFTVVDWGTVISKRSHGSLRLHGDIEPHYSFEARFLFAQQLLHELLAAGEQR